MPAGSAGHVPKIVVGVDGSPSSRAALRWAVSQAALDGGVVDAVLAWQIPALLRNYTWPPIYLEEAGDFETAARKTLEAVISEEIEPADRQLVTSRVVKGHPAQVLLGAAADADLLVVGSRGRSAAARARLGSVCLHCLKHARCPVLIMHGQPGRAAA